MPWLIHFCEEAKRKLKQFNKKWSHEVQNVGDNVDTLFKCLGDGTKAEQLVKLPFVHAEPLGIFAVDERGPGKRTKMKALRLYVYPCKHEQKLYVLTLGDKGSQANDIKLCKGFVSGLSASEFSQQQSEASQGKKNVE